MRLRVANAVPVATLTAAVLSAVRTAHHNARGLEHEDDGHAG
jgi:hypothetical protein